MTTTEETRSRLSVGTPDGRAYPDSPELRQQVLRPYHEHCKYLTAADVYATGDTATVRASFTIGESCYITSTGHFNAVEFNICFNQAMYYLLAKSIQDQLLSVFTGWTLDDYWVRQLSDFFIIDLHSRFRRPITGDHFSGEVTISGSRLRPGKNGKQSLVILPTTVRFWDETGGLCEGEVASAATNPPAAATDLPEVEAA
jgi:hypothetical protein